MSATGLRLQLNAFGGRRSPREPPARQAPRDGWLYRGPLTGPATMLSKGPLPPDLNNWRDPRVGWGVVLAQDAPRSSSLEELIARREAPVFRYLPDHPDGATHLRSERDDCLVSMHLGRYGNEKGALPYYLLIVASPAQIPWRLQYALSANRRIGRLDLDAAGLDNYIVALLRGDQAAAGRDRALIWATDHAPDDITHLMRTAVAEELHTKYRNADGVEARLLAGDGATGEALVRALEQAPPRLVITTSHGNVAPPAATGCDQLGLVVDQHEQVLDASRLLEVWQSDGAIWYAHACCSAGSDADSNFAGLFEPASENGELLESVAARGSTTAPLPKALLGHPKPLRAFIGHVEPTFDLTLQHPSDSVGASALLVEALCEKLAYREPIGHAFRQWHAATGGLATGYEAARRSANRGLDSEFAMFFYRLTFLDVQSTVILGDPATVVWR